jgi:Flp pilus assembly protein TadD
MRNANLLKPALAAVLLLLAGALHAAGMDAAPVEMPRQSDLAAGKAAIDAQDWIRAINSLNRAAAREPRNADIQNYLGYASRKSGNLEAAFRHYNEALRLDPRHRGAHEYIGEAFLMANNPGKAEEHLAVLQQLCGVSCEEYRDLQKSVAEYRARAR